MLHVRKKAAEWCQAYIISVTQAQNTGESYKLGFQPKLSTNLAYSESNPRTYSGTQSTRIEKKNGWPRHERERIIKFK